MHQFDLATLSLHRLPNGAEYLFVTRDETDVTAWVQAINSVIVNGNATPSSQGTSAVSGPPQSQIKSLTHAGNSCLVGYKHLSFILLLLNL